MSCSISKEAINETGPNPNVSANAKHSTGIISVQTKAYNIRLNLSSLFLIGTNIDFVRINNPQGISNIARMEGKVPGPTGLLGRVGKLEDT